MLLAVVAIVVCVVQIGASVGLYSPRDLVLSATASDSDLPKLLYSAEKDTERFAPEGVLAKKDPDLIRSDILGYKGRAIYTGYVHLTYADRCHDGHRRLDQAKLDTLPDFVTEKERAALIARKDQGRARAAELSCDASGTEYAMGDMVDDAHRFEDYVTLLLAGYQNLVKTGQ